MKCITTLFLLLFAFGIDANSQNDNEIIRMEATRDFPILTREGQASNRKPYAPFHAEEDINALAGDDLNFTFHMAAAEGVFTGNAGKYTISLNTLTERDGECVYNVYVNDEPVGLFQQNPPTNEFHAPATLHWTGVEIPENAKIRVESNNWSNLIRHELNFFEYARGRWTSVDFIPERSVEKKSEIGIFENIGDVGLTDKPSNAKYHKVEQAYYISATGERSGKDKDGFGYLSKTANGDFEIEALVTVIGLSENQDQEAGIMIRQSTQADAPYIACIVEGDGRVSLQYREESGAEIKEVLFTVQGAEMVQLVKKGTTYTMSAAIFGEEYERQSIELNIFKGDAKVGFFVCSNSGGSSETVRFSRVRFFEAVQ